MLTSFILCIAALASDDSAAVNAESVPKYAFGARVIIIRETPLRVDNRTIETLPPGTALAVEESHDGYLGVTVDRQGWVDQSDVAPAEDAVEALEPAIANDPDNVRLHEIRLRYACWRGKWEAAVADCTALIRLKPNEPGHYLERAYALSHKGDYDKAIADCDEVIRHDWQLATALLYRGWLWRNKDRLDQAISDFDEALKQEASDPTKSQILLYRGMAYSEQQDWDRALADFNDAIKLTWSNPQIFIKRAGVHVALRHRDEAIDDYSAALFLTPKNASLYAFRADQYIAKKEFEKAQVDINYALAIDPKSQFAICSRGYLHSAQKQFEDAIEDFTRALDVDPQYSYAMGFRAQCYLMLKDYSKARDGYEKAKELDPKATLPISGLAWLYSTCPEDQYRNGRLAVEYATKAAELTKYKKADVLDTLAAAYAEDTNYELAVRTEEQAMSLEKDEKLKKRYRKHLDQYKQQQPFRYIPPGDPDE